MYVGSIQRQVYNKSLPPGGLHPYWTKFTDWSRSSPQGKRLKTVLRNWSNNPQCLSFCRHCSAKSKRNSPNTISITNVCNPVTFTCTTQGVLIFSCLLHMYISPNSKGKLAAEQKYDKKQQISLIPTCVPLMYSVFCNGRPSLFST
jgi:hypothetical protein